MAITSKIAVGESQTPTKNLATYTITEDVVAKELQRVVLTDSNGQEYSGQQTMDNSLPFTISSNQTAIPTNITRVASTDIDSAGLPTKRTLDYVSANRFFTAQLNPTIGTPVAIDIAARNAFLATAPTIIVTAPTNKVSLENLSLLVGTAGTGITSLQYMIIVDTSNRYVSGGTTKTANSTLSGSASTAVVRVSGASPIVASAAGSTTIPVARGVIKSVIPVANDFYEIKFNGDIITAANLTNGTKQCISVTDTQIPVGGTALIYIWGTAQTAATTYESVLSFIE